MIRNRKPLANGMDAFMFGVHASMVMRIQVWYALLCVVIEGYQELGLAYEPLDKLLEKEEFVRALRLYRNGNATFYYQKNPINDKVIGFLDMENSEHWMADLNKQLNAYFMCALPITETIAKTAREGLPPIPTGRLGILLRGPKE